MSGLVIEFHNVEKNIHLIEDFIESFKLELIYIHVNNVSKLDTNGLPSIIEMSFSKFAKTSDNLAFRKHELDFPNNPYLSEIDLTFQD